MLEGAVDWPDTHYIGGDLDDTTLEYARTNAERYVRAVRVVRVAC